MYSPLVKLQVKKEVDIWQDQSRKNNDSNGTAHLKAVF